MKFHGITSLLGSLCAAALLGGNARGAEIVTSIDRTTRGWADLSMGAPSAGDDADQSRNQNPRVVFRYVPAYGKPHADAGAKGLELPRLNDGKGAATGDDPGNSTWFDTRGTSRIVADLQRPMDVARINVFSWHSGALSPQRYTLWASDREPAPSAEPEDLSANWVKLATVDTTSLGEGGKHGSSVNAVGGTIGRFRHLLFDLPANRPDWSRSGFLSEIDVYAAGRKLDEITVLKRAVGLQALKFGPMLRTHPLQDETPFLLAGPKLYEFGAMDGTFPAVGRLDGDQGGLWSHPIKLLNGFDVEVREAGQRPWRLVGPDRFEHQFATATFEFNRSGLRAIRRDFVPEEESALISQFTLHNDTDKTRTLTLQFTGAVNLRPSYESQLTNGVDVVEYKDGLMQGYDTRMADQWGVVFGADRRPSEQRVDGNQGVLSYALELAPGGETTLQFLILGEHTNGVNGARSRFPALLQQAGESLARKQAHYRERILGGVKFTSSDAAMTDAFLCAKANVVLSLMDLRPGYPAPFLAAGFPIYTWLFGCDSLHSTPGVAAAGFAAEARDTLRCLLHFADRKKQGAHEVASNGRLLGWDHIQETPQLVHACWEHFQWTRDRTFLQQAYSVCVPMLTHALATADADHDGYLEGPALMEQAGMGSERLDSVGHLYAAYEALANMAETLGVQPADDYRLRARELKTRFNRDWWNPQENMWACSLRADHTPTMDNFWAVVFPQRLGIADPDKALLALDRLQREWVNDQWGFVAQWKPKIANEGVGVVHNTVLAQTAFNFSRPELAWKLMKLSAKAPLEERMLGAFDETLPGGGDLIQLWSFGPFLQNVIEGLAGIRPQFRTDQIDLFPQLPTGLSWYKVEGCRIGTHLVTLEHRQTGNAITTTVTHTQGDAPISGIFWLPARTGPSVQVAGQPIQVTQRPLPLSGLATPGIPYQLAPGQTLQIVRHTP